MLIYYEDLYLWLSTMTKQKYVPKSWHQLVQSTPLEPWLLCPAVIYWDLCLAAAG